MWQSQPDVVATAPVKAASEACAGGGDGEQMGTAPVVPASDEISGGGGPVPGQEAGAIVRSDGGRSDRQGGGARAAAHAATDSAEGRLRVLWTGAVVWHAVAWSLRKPGADCGAGTGAGCHDCVGMLEHGRSSLALVDTSAEDGVTQAEAAETQLLRRLDNALRHLHACQSRLGAAYQQIDVALAAAEARLPRAIIQSWRWHPPSITTGNAMKTEESTHAMSNTCSSAGACEPEDGCSVDCDPDDSEEHLCVICITALEAHEGGVRLPCGHFFHELCVAEWLRRHSSCPHCRARLVGSDKCETVV
jgi:hypothetical protein